MFKFRRDPQIKTILDAMKSYNYSNTIDLFENMLKELITDPILKILLKGMVYNLKKKYLRYIVQHSSAVPIKHLGNLLKTNDSSILEFILQDIKQKTLEVKIDLIDQVIYSSPKDNLTDTMKSTLQTVENSYLSNFRKYSQ